MDEEWKLYEVTSTIILKDKDGVEINSYSTTELIPRQGIELLENNYKTELEEALKRCCVNDGSKYPFEVQVSVQELGVPGFKITLNPLEQKVSS